MDIDGLWQRWRGRRSPQLTSLIDMDLWINTPGCVLCLGIAHTVDHFLELLFFENVNDEGFRTEWRQSFGFCPTHTESLIRVGDALGSTILYLDLLERIEKYGVPQRKQPCPVCRLATEAYHRYVVALDQYLTHKDVDVQLCWTHLQQINQDVKISAKTRRMLVEQQMIRWRGQISQLEQNMSAFKRGVEPEDQVGFWHKVVIYFADKI